MYFLCHLIRTIIIIVIKIIIVKKQDKLHNNINDILFLKQIQLLFC